MYHTVLDVDLGFMIMNLINHPPGFLALRACMTRLDARFMDPVSGKVWTYMMPSKAPPHAALFAAKMNLRTNCKLLAASVGNSNVVITKAPAKPYHHELVCFTT